MYCNSDFKPLISLRRSLVHEQWHVLHSPDSLDVPLIHHQIERCCVITGPQHGLVSFGSSSLSKPTLRSKDIVALHPNEVQHNMETVLKTLDFELHQATQGTLIFPVPVLLQRIATLCKRHPSVKAWISPEHTNTGGWGTTS